MLTTNLGLSIWVSDSDPKVSRSWKRVLIANHELERYCQKLYAEDETRAELDWEIRRRLRRRIRSFAWSPQLRSQASDQSIQEAQLPVNGSFIAVSNDNNDVVVLRIHSPHSFLSPSATTWSAHAVAHFSLEPKLDLHPNPRPILLEETMDEQRHISNLAWSPWTTSKDGISEAVLACTTNHGLHLRRIRIFPFSSVVSLDSSDIFSSGDVGTRNTNLIRWMPRVCNGFLYLITFGQSGAFCFEVPVEDPSKTTVTTHDVDGRWDLFAGEWRRDEPQYYYPLLIQASLYVTAV